MDTHGGDRVAARIEEIILDAHTPATEHIAPGFGDGVFRGAGGTRGGRQFGGARPFFLTLCDERATVQFAARRDG